MVGSSATVFMKSLFDVYALLNMFISNNNRTEGSVYNKTTKSIKL